MMANVLVVDDEVQVRNLIKQLLEINGYKCTLAPDTNHARSYLNEDTLTSSSAI